MSMHEASAAHKAKAEQMLGEKFGILTADIAKTRASGLVQRAAQVGQPAPEFALPDAFGATLALSQVLQKGPVVLSFYRGEWCPFCNIELHAFQGVMPRIQELGATLIAISPEKPDFGVIATEKHKLTFPVLSDLGNTVARKYGLVYQMSQELKEMSLGMFGLDVGGRNGDSTWELPVPATFVIDTHRVIRYAHVDPDYMLSRASPPTVIAALESIASNARRS
jgi:peroxiredoxin